MLFLSSLDFFSKIWNFVWFIEGIERRRRVYGSHQEEIFLRLIKSKKIHFESSLKKRIKNCSWFSKNGEKTMEAYHLSICFQETKNSNFHKNFKCRNKLLHFELKKKGIWICSNLKIKNFQLLRVWILWSELTLKIIIWGLASEQSCSRKKKFVPCKRRKFFKTFFFSSKFFLQSEFEKRLPKKIPFQMFSFQTKSINGIQPREINHSLKFYICRDSLLYTEWQTELKQLRNLPFF